MTRTVVVSHEATLTGAPMVALLVTRQLVEQGVPVRVVSRTKGPLLAEFARLAPTRRELLAGVRRRLWLVPGLSTVARGVDVALAAATLALHRPELVYLNTTASAVYLPAARLLRLPVVLHVHESETTTEALLARARVQDLEGVHLVACSPSVHAHLVARTGREPEGVALLPSVPDEERVRAGARRGAHRPRPGVRRVGAVGSAGHRKGTDLWLRVAAAVRQDPTAPPTEFVWVGGSDPAWQAPAVPGVDFAGPTENPYPTIAGLDVFTLTSRDDPFPLVVVEAMMLGVPVVAFDVGSVREQVGDGGVIVPAGDVGAFTSALKRLLTDDAARAAAGARARARAERLHSTSAFAARLRTILGDLAGQAPRMAARQSR